MNLSDLTDTVMAAAGRAFDRLLTSDARHFTPIYEITINGKPMGNTARNRLISLTDNRGLEADELTLELDDSDGALAIPEQDAVIALQLGYKEIGLVDKGSYKLSEFAHQGAPDRLSITARSADLSEKLAQQEEKSWHRTTLYQIIETIAKKHGYTPKIAESFKAVAIDHIDQTSESDASFIERLAQSHDAVATIKSGHLLFMPAGAAVTVSGQPLDTVFITRQTGDNHRFTYSTTDNYQAVRAYYTEQGSGKKKEVIITAENVEGKKVQTKITRGKNKGKTKTKIETPTVSAEGKKTKTLRHLYTSKAHAEGGARAAYKKLKRGAPQFSITLAQGRPDLTPETPVNVSGFKDAIDGADWIVKKVDHQLSDAGYTCTLELEMLIDFEKEAEAAKKASAAKPQPKS